MKNKIKYLLYLLIGVSLLGCSPTTIPSVNQTVEPTTEPTIVPTIDPTIIPSEDPTTDPYTIPTIPLFEDDESFYIKNIDAYHVDWIYIDELHKYRVNYSNEVYDVDNYIFQEFYSAFAYKFEIEYNGKYNVDELEISLNEYGFEVIYMEQNDPKVSYIDKQMSIRVENVNSKIIFFIRNTYENIHNGVAGTAGELPYLELTINKAKYNNEWIEVTENNISQQKTLRVNYGIYKYAFTSSTITSLTISSSVTSILAYAFANSNIDTIICRRKTPPSIATEAFNGLTKAITIYIPVGSASNY
jgi:hypothetical protein